MDYQLSNESLEQCRDRSDPHIIVAMSGGVDSSVTALLLKRAGYRVSAIFMKNWNEPRDDQPCEWEKDVEDVLAVCEPLDIPVNTVDLSKNYWDSVFEEFVDEYRRGRTPNPDILCNREIKFKAFLEHATSLGGDLIATGHYARIQQDENRHCQLMKGLDPSKDQSYFLYAIGQAALHRTIFPIGGLEKRDVRQIASEAGLATSRKKDSTGICFIGERRFRDFLGQYLPAKPGDIRDTNGVVIGRHPGAAFYTLGQREGLGIGGVRGSVEGPWFVVAKDVGKNELIAAQGHNHPLLMTRSLSADTLSWISGEAPRIGLQCRAKTRYRQSDQPCTIREIDGNRLTVNFSEPQRAVTPGQSVVFYVDDRCIGGAIIDQTE
ncbi:MAG: tRNA-specific 2-thiouridylase [Gammaproteobacteria bacterium]|jgi:tRNA-specific 2-thiouridylase